MSSTSRVHRLPRLVVVLILLAVGFLAGCLRYTQSLTIHPDDTVSGIIIIAAQPPDDAGADQAPTAPAGLVLPEPTSDSENIVVTPFEHDQESGYKVTFTRVSFAELAAFAPLGNDGGALLITRYGDQLQLMMTLDLTYTLPVQQQQYIATHAETTLAVHVPGEVSETNGEVSGDMITWQLKPFTVNTVSATIESPAHASVRPEGVRSIDPQRAAMLAGGALVVLVLGWFLLRRYLQPSTAAGAHRASSSRRNAPAHRVLTNPDASSQPIQPAVVDRRDRRAVRNAPDPFGEPDPVVRSAQSTSRVRPVREIDEGGWPPPRPLWREHR